MTYISHKSMKPIKPVCYKKEVLEIGKGTKHKHALCILYIIDQVHKKENNMRYYQLIKNVYKPWFPGIMKHCGPSYSVIFDTPGGSSGLSKAICSSLYQGGGCRAYSKGLKKRLSYVNDEGFGYLQIRKRQIYDYDALMQWTKSCLVYRLCHMYGQYSIKIQISACK